MHLKSIAMGFCMALAIGSASAQTMLTLGHATSQTSVFNIGAKAFSEEFSRLTQDRYKVKIYPSGAKGGEKELIEKLQKSEIDLVVCSTGPVGTFVPETLITDIPFLFRNYAHARKTLDGPIGQELLAKFPAHNIVALAWGENGFRHLTNSKHAVVTPQDMQGLTLRTMENPVHILAFRTLGAKPVPMPFTELFNALNSGSVDGEENPIPLIVASKFGYVQKNLLLTGHVYSPALILASPAFVNSLSPADKKLLMDAAKFGAQAMRQSVDESEADGIAKLKAQGVNVITDVDKAKFQAALAPAYAEYAKQFGEDAIKRIRNVK